MRHCGHPVTNREPSGHLLKSSPKSGRRALHTELLAVNSNGKWNVQNSVSTSRGAELVAENSHCLENCLRDRGTSQYAKQWHSGGGVQSASYYAWVEAVQTLFRGSIPMWERAQAVPLVPTWERTQGVLFLLSSTAPCYKGRGKALMTLLRRLFQPLLGTPSAQFQI